MVLFNRMVHVKSLHALLHYQSTQNAPHSWGTLTLNANPITLNALNANPIAPNAMNANPIAPNAMNANPIAPNAMNANPKHHLDKKCLQSSQIWILPKKKTDVMSAFVYAFTSAFALKLTRETHQIDAPSCK